MNYCSASSNTQEAEQRRQLEEQVRDLLQVQIACQQKEAKWNKAREEFDAKCAKLETEAKVRGGGPALTPVLRYTKGTGKGMSTTQNPKACGFGAVHRKKHYIIFCCRDVTGQGQECANSPSLEVLRMSTAL